METKANYVAVGAFVLLCILGIVVALLWLAGFQYSREYAAYRTSFEGPVTGLGQGTAVRYNGIDVGRVQDLAFDPNDPKRVIVTMQVKPEVRIPADSFASIASEGLTGGSYVEIDGGSTNAPKLGEDGNPVPTIASRPSTLQQLEQSAPKLIEKLNHVADDLQAVLNPQNRAAITHILDNLDKTTAAISARTPEIQTTLSNAATASATLNTDLQDVHTVLGNANIAVVKVNKLVDDADNFVNGEGTQQLTQLIGETRRMVNSLSRLSGQIDREPTRLLFGDRHKGYAPMSELVKLERRFFLVGAAALTLSGCSNLIGPQGDSQLYVLKPDMPKVPGPPVSWRLAVTRPDAPQNLDSARISISRTATTMDYYAGAIWGDRLSELVRTLTVHAFESTGRIASVAEDSVGAQHDYTLEMDIRNFEARYDTPDGAPVGVVRIHAKLITQLRQAILADTESAHEVQAGANSVDAAVIALDQAFGQVLADIVGWTLRSGPPLPA